jgi:hypothetical protein
MDSDRIRIELTKEQREQLKRATGKDFEVLEYTFEEFEQRVAPYYFVNAWPSKYLG